MSELDDLLGEIEKYGFNRRRFPLKSNGHDILLLHNDAYRTKEGRVRMNFSLHCLRCDTESHVSGKFPSELDRQEERVVNAKVAALAQFEESECS